MGHHVMLGRRMTMECQTDKAMDPMIFDPTITRMQAATWVAVLIRVERNDFATLPIGAPRGWRYFAIKAADTPKAGYFIQALP